MKTSTAGDSWATILAVKTPDRVCRAGRRLCPAGSDWTIAGGPDNQNLILTSLSLFSRINPMKVSSILILAVLLLSLISPLAVHVTSALPDSGRSLVTLDVCHASDSSLSVNADSPSLHECPCKYVPLAFAGIHESDSAVFVPYLISVQHERPPRV